MLYFIICLVVVIAIAAWGDRQREKLLKSGPPHETEEEVLRAFVKKWRVEVPKIEDETHRNAMAQVLAENEARLREIAPEGERRFWFWRQ